MSPRLGIVVLAGGAAAWLAGCPAAPRPIDLDDLRLMLDSPVVAETSPRAPELVAEARALQADAEAAYEDGDLDGSAEIARLAQVKVRRAVAAARRQLAGERQAEAERTLAEAETAYGELETQRQDLEARLARLWDYRRAAEEIARERAQAVEEEALRAERLPEAERATWERNWRRQAKADAAEAERTLRVAQLLGAAEAYPEAARMAAEAVQAAVDAVETSPWRIERPLVDYAAAQGDELRYRMLALADAGGQAAYGRALEALAQNYRTGFDPPFNVRLEPRGVVLALDGKSAEIRVAFPQPIAQAFTDLAAKWAADPALRALVTVRSLDAACGEDCGARTTELAERVAAAVGGAAAGRIRSQGIGYTTDVPPVAGLDRNGAVRIEILLFPGVELPASVIEGHTAPVDAGSQP